MLLTITCLQSPATDLGYLLHKHPLKVQTFSLSFGQAHVFYPEVSEERCTAALLLDVDPVGLVRKKQQDRFALEQYVNDRPYVSSSFMSVAIAQIYSSALAGKCKERPELVSRPLPLEATLTSLPIRGNKEMLERIFRPLGYEIEATTEALDEQFPEWGTSPYYQVKLKATVCLKDLLAHLYVLIPVLDNEKHYWIGEDELKKLLRFGEEWLKNHPEKEWIVRRYLKNRQYLMQKALEQLEDEERMEEETAISLEEQVEKPVRLNDQRLQSVYEVVKASGAERVIDLGCGEGKLLKLFFQDQQFTKIAGMDVSVRSLEIAKDRLRLDRVSEKQRDQICLLHGSLLYRDPRLLGFEAATVVEVIEHLEPERLHFFEDVLFSYIHPNMIVVTTPNREYNSRYEIPEGKYRHADHRFEWTRAEFQAWARKAANRYHYEVEFHPIGPVDEEVGSPTQMAVFRKVEEK